MQFDLKNNRRIGNIFVHLFSMGLLHSLNISIICLLTICLKETLISNNPTDEHSLKPQSKTLVLCPMGIQEMGQSQELT